MKYRAQIDVMPLQEILDPQGKAVKKGLENLGLNTIEQVRIGKHITMEINAGDEAAAKEIIETACKKLLANLIMESYTYKIIIS